ncbi:MAG: S9 family peptidase [Gammaproteobacteria bacterium]
MQRSSHTPVAPIFTRFPMWRLACLVFLVVAYPHRSEAHSADSCHHQFPISSFTGPTPLTGFMPHAFAWSPNGQDLAYLIQRAVKGPNTLVVVDARTGRTILRAGVHRLGAALRPASSIHNDRIREWTGRYGLVNYRWSPGGHHLIFTNGHVIGKIGVKSDRVTTLARVSGWPTQFTLSPHGHWLSFVLHHTIEVVKPGASLKPHPIRRPQRDMRIGALDWTYREELGLRSGYAWSPRGHELVFIEFDERGVLRYPLLNNVRQHPTIYWQRYPEPGAKNPRARLGLYNTQTDKIRWISIPGLAHGYLARFGWYEHGRALYAEVLNRAQTLLHLDRISSKNGTIRNLLTLNDPDWIDVRNDLVFLPHGGFIFGTDQSGWHHLDRFNRNGQKVASLTPGPGNVAHLLSVNVRTKRVYYLISPGLGPRTNRIESVSFNGHDRHRVFPAQDDESAIFAPHARYLLLIQSDATHPPVFTIHPLSGRTDWVLARGRLPAGIHLKPPHFLRIPSADPRIRINAEMFYPEHFNPHHRYPVVMYQYGGPDVPALISQSWNPWIEYDERLACEGFIVFEADNRVASTFSHTQQALVKDHLGRIELADQHAAVDWLKKLPYVAKRQIGIWGWSYGGYMTLYELTHAPTVWHAGIAVAPVTRWQDYDSIYTERYMGTPETNPDGYHASSDVRSAARLRAHLLLVAGTGDDNVHWQNTLQFIQALTRADRPYRLLIFPNNTHVLSGHRTRLELFRTMNRFWEETLLRHPRP